MRQKRTSQASIFEAFAAHDIGRELQAMSQWLDEHPEVLEWLHEDLRRETVQGDGTPRRRRRCVARC